MIATCDALSGVDVRVGRATIGAAAFRVGKMGADPDLERFRIDVADDDQRRVLRAIMRGIETAQLLGCRLTNDVLAADRRHDPGAGIAQHQHLIGHAHVERRGIAGPFFGENDLAFGVERRGIEAHFARGFAQKRQCAFERRGIVVRKIVGERRSQRAR